MPHSFISTPRKEELSNFTYEKRYLDAIANIFWVHNTDCTATTLCNGTFYISFNESLTGDNKKNVIKKFNNLAKVINNHINNIIDNPIAKKELLNLHLAYSFRNYKSQLKKITTELPDSIKNLFSSNSDDEKKEESQKIPVIINNFLKLANEKNDNNINLVLSFNEILGSLKNCNKQDLRDKNVKEFINILLRPLQDVEKLLYFLKNSHIKVKYHILENPAKIHAELNIAHQLKDLLPLDAYIGVSKLCCGACDYALSEYHHKSYRGTHGVCDYTWLGEDMAIKEKEELKTIFSNLRKQSSVVKQKDIRPERKIPSPNRTLSDDELEMLFDFYDETDAKDINTIIPKFEFQYYKDTLLSEVLLSGDGTTL